MLRRIIVWGVPAALFAAFATWYTDLRGPLDADEIRAFAARLEADGAPPEMRANLRRFMEQDSGRQFLMLNAIELADDPPDVPGAEPGEDAWQLLGRYMEHMNAELLRRACHPVVLGDAVFRAVDLVGIEGAEEWTLGALMRYRSRRSFMEIVVLPETRDRHRFKVAALSKTIAYPIETRLYLGDARLLVGLLLALAACVGELAWARRSA